MAPDIVSRVIADFDSTGRADSRRSDGISVQVVEDNAMADDRSTPSPEDLKDVPPEYWLGVCSGQAAAESFVAADSGEAVGRTLGRYPILALPEFPSAIEALGERIGNPEAAEACRMVAQELRSFQGRFRGDEPAGFAVWLS